MLGSISVHLGPTGEQQGTYCGNSQEHDHQGLLAEDGMLYQLVGKTNKSPSSLFKKDSGIGCKMSPIHCELHESEVWKSVGQLTLHSFGR